MIKTSLLLLLKDSICELIDSKLLQFIMRLLSLRMLSLRILSLLLLSLRVSSLWVLSQEGHAAFPAHAETALISSFSAAAEILVLAAI